MFILLPGKHAAWMRGKQSAPAPQKNYGKIVFMKPTLTDMNNRLVRPVLPALAGLFLLLAGCSSVNLWPFGGGREQDANRAPSNATEYRCAGGKGFYLRYLENGGAAWIILPEREFRLDKANSTGTRYSNGVASLDLTGSEAMLSDGSAISLTGCKVPATK